MTKHLPRTVARMATAREVAALLGGTSVPPALSRALVGGAPDLWLNSGSASTLAADLVLAHPELSGGEVRAAATVARDRRSWRLTVAAHDRPGLLADTAGLIAQRGITVSGAAAATWQQPALAIHALTMPAPLPSPPLLHALGASLRLLASGLEAPPVPAFKAVGRASVSCVGAIGEEKLLRVTATDQVGLLWAMARWLADSGCSIQAAWLATTAGEANDVLAVRGEPDCAAMADHLSEGSLAAVADA